MVEKNKHRTIPLGIEETAHALGFKLLMDEDGNLTLIDEIHTPDSSRFWIRDTYEELFSKGKEPQKLDKEYVRQFLAEKGFIGDSEIPEIPDKVKVEAAKRYIKAYEVITGKEFEAKNENILKRIKRNIKKYLS